MSIEVTMDSVTLWIDDRQTTTKSHRTVMEAADELGIAIPRLCFHPSLKPSGACRLCAVEIEGFRGLPAACSTPISPGMRVRTTSAKVVEFRREMLRLILLEHPRECLGCSRNGTCELQGLIETIGVDFPYPPPERCKSAIETVGSFFERDYSLCVRCGRCVRVCHEVRGAKAIVFRDKNGRREVGAPLNLSAEETGCRFCGACADVCPVGALREKPPPGAGGPHSGMPPSCSGLSNIVRTLHGKEMVRTSIASVCPICPEVCGMEFERAEDDEIIRARPSVADLSNGGQACVQGRFLLKGHLRGSDRALKPMVRDNGGFREVDWDTALDITAERFGRYPPEERAVLTDGRSTNEELYCLRKFARTALQTNATGCVSPPGHAAVTELLRKTLGSPAGVGSLRELGPEDCILSIGFNPSTSRPISGIRLREAVLRGASLVAATPCDEGVVRYADAHLRHYPGTEKVLLAGLLRLLLDRNYISAEMARRWEPELKALGESLADCEPAAVSRITGVSREDLAEAAHLIGNSRRVSALLGLGAAGAPQAAEIAGAALALLQIRGDLGKPGCVVAPLYGTGNFIGAWEMGMPSHLQPGSTQRAEGPRDILAAVDAGKIKALYLSSESFESGELDSMRTSLEKLDFLVVHRVVSPRAESPAPTSLGDVILPMAATLEKGGSFFDGERNARRIQPIVSAPGEARSVQWVVAELAARMNAPGFDPEDLSTEAEDMVKRVSACAVASVEERAVEWIGLQPNLQYFSEDLGDEGYPFAVIAKEDLLRYCLGPLSARGPAAVFGSDEEMNMNPADVFSMGLNAGDTVRVVTRRGEWEGPIRINHLVPVKTLAVSMRSIRLHGDLGDTVGGAFAAAVVKG